MDLGATTTPVSDAASIAIHGWLMPRRRPKRSKRGKNHRMTATTHANVCATCTGLHAITATKNYETMSEYSKDTVGWHLNRLKEPLRSRAIEIGKASLQEHCLSLKEAVDYIYEMGDYPDEDSSFWTGVQKQIMGMQAVYGNLFLADAGWEGYNMAKDCAPDPAEISAPAEDRFMHIESHGFIIPLSKHGGEPAQPEIGEINDNPCPQCWYGSHDHSGPLVCTGKCKPLNAMYNPDLEDGAVPPPPRKFEKTDGFNPAVEGYKPPVCVTESEMLVDALKRIKFLEEIVSNLLRIYHNQ